MQCRVRWTASQGRSQHEAEEANAFPDLVRVPTIHRRRRMLLFWEHYTKYYQHLTYRARVLVAALSKELESFVF